MTPSPAAIEAARAIFDSPWSRNSVSGMARALVEPEVLAALRALLAEQNQKENQQP